MSQENAEISKHFAVHLGPREGALTVEARRVAEDLAWSTGEVTQHVQRAISAPLMESGRRTERAPTRDA